MGKSISFDAITRLHFPSTSAAKSFTSPIPFIYKLSSEYIKKSVISSLYHCYISKNNELANYAFAPTASLNDENIVIANGGAA